MSKVYETLHIAPQLADPASFPLVTDIQYFEPLTSKSLNRKFCGIARAGIYRGFACSPSGDLNLQVECNQNQDGTSTNYGVALVERDDYLLTVRQQHTVTLAIPAGQVSYIVLEAYYEHGVKTSQVDAESDIDAATLMVVTEANLKTHHVILCVADVEAGATVLTNDHLSFDLRMIGGYDLDAHKGELDPHTQYVRKDADSTVDANIDMLDGRAVNFGDEKGLVIEHTGDVGRLDSSVGDLYARQLATDGKIHLQVTDSDGNIVDGILVSGGETPSVIATYGGLQRLETTSEGVTIEGVLEATAEVSENGQRVYSPNNPNVSDSVTSSSATVYASAKAAKTAYDRATAAETTALAYTDTRIAELLGEAPQEALDTLTELAEALNGADDAITGINTALANRALITTAINVSGAITGGGTLGSDMTIGVDTATTSQEGVVKLSNSISSASTTLAATPYAVKQAYDLAATKLNATATAVNAALLDNLDSTQFLRSDVAALKSAGSLIFADNVSLQIGTGGDLQIFHNAYSSFLANSTGNLYLRCANQNQVFLQAQDADSVYRDTIGAFGGTAPYAVLYHNGTNRLQTTSAGVTVNGTVSATTFSGNLTGKLSTARNLTIGNSSKSFDGSADVSWSASEMGLVDTSNAQTIAGTKTFNDTVLLKGSTWPLRFQREVDGWSLLRWQDSTGLEHARIGLTSGNVFALTMYEAVTGGETDVKSWTFNPNGNFTIPNSAFVNGSQENYVNALTRKDYVDGLDAANVKLTGDQEIDGAKTFLKPLSARGDATGAAVKVQDSAGNERYRIQAFTGSRVRHEFESTNQIEFASLGNASFRFNNSSDVIGVEILPDAGYVTVKKTAPTYDAELTRKDYVDGLDSANVKLTGAQSISGAKTFTEATYHGGHLTFQGGNRRLEHSVSGAGIQFGAGGAVTLRAGDGAGNEIAASGLSLNTTGTVGLLVQGTATGHLITKGYVDTLDAGNLKLTGGTLTGELNLASGNGGGISWEGGKHWITNNDGGGNFNFRIGNKIGVATEAGTQFHQTWDNDGTSGSHHFKVDNSGGYAVGDTISWVSQFVYNRNTVSLRYQGSERLITSGDGVTVTGNVKITGTPSATTDAATVGHVATLDAANVKLTGAQTIAGAKTFSTSVAVNGAVAATKASGAQVSIADAGTGWYTSMRFNGGSNFDGEFWDMGVRAVNGAGNPQVFAINPQSAMSLTENSNTFELWSDGKAYLNTTLGVSGNISIADTPSDDTHAITKGYLDEWANDANNNGSYRRIYVNAVSGDDSNDGLSTSTPVKTIAQAVQLCHAGQNIVHLIGGGVVYELDSRLSLSTRDITFITMGAVHDDSSGWAIIRSVQISNASGLYTAGGFNNVLGRLRFDRVAIETATFTETATTMTDYNTCLVGGDSSCGKVWFFWCSVTINNAPVICQHQGGSAGRLDVYSISFAINITAASSLAVSTYSQKFVGVFSSAAMPWDMFLGGTSIPSGYTWAGLISANTTNCRNNIGV